MYRSVPKSFAKFLGFDINDLHNHLTPKNLKNYATSPKDNNLSGTELNKIILRRYYWIKMWIWQTVDLNERP